MTPRFWTLSTALACALGLAASSARAQADADAEAARSQYNAGTKAFANQRYAEAALAFEAAADAKPSPVALFTAALSWDKTNAPDRAADDYARALALSGLPADKSAQAKDRLALLESMLGAITVSGVDGARVQLDANSERPVPATLHGSSGVHTLTVRAPGAPIERRSVVLERGKTTALDTRDGTPAARVRRARTAAAWSSASAGASSCRCTGDWKKPVGIAATGVGGATLLAGVLLGFEATDAKNAYVAAPAHATYDHASALQTWTNVAFIAGGVITAGGLALILWPSHGGSEPAKAEVSLLPGGLLVKGAF